MPPTVTPTDAAAATAEAAPMAPGSEGPTVAEPQAREATATVIVVGAGPAGLGTAGLLEKCGIDVIVLERGEVGQTFKAW